MAARTIADVPSPSVTRRAGPQDACPGALRVHQAADGGLARVRVPGGLLSGRQWQVLVSAAAELGNGHLELTSRGNLQLRGLGTDAAESLAGRLTDAGLLPSLTHERVRNLLASPLSGRDGGGLADVRPLIAEFDQALTSRPALAELSGRFLFALDDGRADVLAIGPDIAVTATSSTTVRLLLAGRYAGAPVPIGSAVELMLAAAEAFLAERRAQGSDAWRLAELTDGPARVAARLGLTTSGLPHPTGPAPAPGPLRQSDGRQALVLGIPLGSLNTAQAGVLSAPRLILTPWRSVVLPGLGTAAAAVLLNAGAAQGLITDGTDPLNGVTACTGRPGCASALADVRADAIAAHAVAGHAVAAHAVAGHQAEPIAGPVHWSGCSRRCGRPAGTVIDVVATGDGYRVSSAGRSTDVGGSSAQLRVALCDSSNLVAAR
ncbi:MAG: precorrin-3B synthase [Pseudonocardiales bacterium]|jgi:precorrin-3B synthase|nr:precorrin-3B synthase [Pseudonocardiales bacterium]